MIGFEKKEQYLIQYEEIATHFNLQSKNIAAWLESDKEWNNKNCISNKSVYHGAAFELISGCTDDQENTNKPKVSFIK